MEQSGVMEWSEISVTSLAISKQSAFFNMQNIFHVSYMGVKDCQNNRLPYIIVTVRISSKVNNWNKFVCFYSMPSLNA